ncbi:YihY/virulence factor BrkB family protein [Bacillus massiliglaciei]|uniref:YihY/virulence factor BrkB family protein n=1 Tax=Bacillus massiliglaciei TaxID=1816693 RepID=UPI000AB94796|nr:YihY/virulence factor BrkB family protein [Bacillus massiliglaciei]
MTVKWLDLSSLRHLIHRFKQDDIAGLAAQLSYFFILSLFPLLIVLFTLMAYLPFSNEELLHSLRAFAPEESMEMIESQLREVLKGDGRLLSLGIIGTLWSASNGLNAIVKAFNRAYEVKESRSFFVARGMSVILTLAMLFVIVVALLLPVFGKQIGFALFSGFGFSEAFLDIWNGIRWGISFLVLVIVFAMLYWMAPNLRLNCLSILPGALFATAGWMITSFVFSYYVDRIAHYSTTYGSLGGIIALMIWFYLSGLIIIIGGEINALHMKKTKPNCR